MMAADIRACELMGPRVLWTIRLHGEKPRETVAATRKALLAAGCRYAASAPAARPPGEPL